MSMILAAFLGMILGSMIGIPLGIATIDNNNSNVKTAEATGGILELKPLIDGSVDRSIKALDKNNTELALEELTTLKEELQDRFSLEEKEKEEEKEEEEG